MTGRFVPILDPVRSGRNIAGRLRVVAQHVHNDLGPWPWWGISDFTGIHYVQTGQESVITKRYDAYAAAGRTIVRTFANLNWPWFGIAIDWRSPGYWEALERDRQVLNERGLYMHLTCYGAAEFFQNDGQYREATRRYAEFTRDHPGVFLHLANEPYKNGWTNADDPRLLELADLAASILGHRDFAVGDAGDGNIPVLQTVARHCNVALIHPTRTEHQDGRWRNWVDHLKEAADILPQLPSSALVFDEPMGAGTRDIGRRDDDPDALLAAMLVSIFCETGFVYHWIAEERAFEADALPGMVGFDALRQDLPIAPDWTFSNSAPVAGIVWAGLVGKTRNTLHGTDAWSVAYGEAAWDSLRWMTGWNPRERFAGPRIRVTTLTR